MNGETIFMLRIARPLFGATAILLLTVALIAKPPAQPPKDEKGPLPFAPKAFPREDEDPLSPGIVKKIELDDEGVDANVPKGAAYFKLGAIARLIPNTRDPVLKDFYTKWSVAYDRISESSGKRVRVCLLPLHREQKFPARFGAFELTDANLPKPFARAFEMGRVNGIRQFEELAIEQARDLLKPTPLTGATPLEQLPAGVKAEAAETLLTATLFVHESARDKGKRKGPGWEKVGKAITDELALTRNKRLKQAVSDGNWALARELGNRMIALYGATPERLEEVYSAKLSEAEAVLEQAGERPAELERVHLALHEYEAKSPKPDQARVAKVRTRLTELSKKLLERADDLVQRDPGAAGRLVTDASLFDPENPKVAELRSTLNLDYSVLVVGYRRLPERMSPALARYDSEFHAVELMFEGLIDPVPDEQVGTWYRPVLALSKPDVVSNARAFQLQRSAVWAGADRSGLDAADVRGTIELLRQRSGMWEAYPLDWISDVRVDDPSRVRVNFSRGHIDPRAIVSFKILPARWLVSQSKSVDDITFATKPFGTGPFALAESNRAGEVLFRANVAYGRRPDRPGQPSIKEIRFVSLVGTRVDPVAELVNDRIHMIPDVPSIELDKFKNLTTKSGKSIQTATARDNRRVWTLAVNHRNPILRDPNVRRGLAHAIDREAILNDVFRSPALAEKPHVAMTGPFPPMSWATPRPNFAAAGGGAQAPPPLLNRDLATAKFSEYLKAAGNRALSLLYPADDPQAKNACEKIKKMVEDLAKIEGNALTIRLDPAVPTDYYRRIRDEHGYDLAYSAFDYPDDWYPFALGAALDPTAAGRGGRNCFGYLVADATYVPTDADRRLGTLLSEIRMHRDPAKLASLAGDIHAKFNETMPFIPLWQLDRHIVISAAVKPWTDDSPRPLSPRFLDPARLFSNVSKWRVE
jgi:peptide/nickel transport system substrate-binding protein